MTRDWHDHMMHLVAVAEYGLDTEVLRSAVDVVHFFESPRKYTDLFDAYDNHQSEQGELQDERKATL